MAAGEPSTPPAAPPPGAPSGRNKVLVLVVVAVLAVAVLAVAFVLLSGTVPLSLDRVQVTAAKNSIDQREETVVSAVAIDTRGGNQTAAATWTWTATPSGRVQLTPLTPASRATVVALDSGTVTLTARATLSNVTRNGTLAIAIARVHFEVSPSNTNPLTEEAIDLDVRAARDDDSTVTGYRGEVTFTSDDPLATLPANTTFTATDAGTRTFTGVVLRTAGTVTITVRDRLATTVSGSTTVTVERPSGAPSATFTFVRDLMHVDVDATASTDPENDITSYEWAWGDGQVSGPSLLLSTASHDYTTPGRYSIVLTVTDLATNSDVTARTVTVATSTVDYEFYDFFAEPFGEWWDYRTAVYGDLPINAECFNQTAIDNGVCDAPNASVQDVPSYPYTMWYPAPGALQWFNPNANPLIYAPYRFTATGANVVGYNLSEPVFLPVLNYSQPRGSRLDFQWYLQYLDTATADALGASGCAIDSGALDGFNVRSQITLTMDLQESRRIFNVQAADATSAQQWWDANTSPACFPNGAVESAWDAWAVSLGGSTQTVGKYDIYNSFEWFYQPFSTNIVASVDLDGTTHVTIDHSAWGTEVLLARIFYWGNVSYAQNYLDSTKAAGWWGMELAWFEDFNFTGSLGTANVDLRLDSVMQYHFQLLARPGADGFVNRVGDVPYWTWGPVLTDYANDASPRHPISELDRYPAASYLHTTPGGSNYNKSLPYEVVPSTWDLEYGQTWHFVFPSGNVVLYDPNLTPVPANPRAADYVAVFAPLQFDSTVPAALGSWDATAYTWDVIGATATGGPAGTPGADGVPGTADDEYALEPWGAVLFVAGGPAPAPALLAVSGAVEPAASSPILRGPHAPSRWSSRSTRH